MIIRTMQCWVITICILIFSIGHANAATVDFSVTGTFTDEFQDVLPLTGFLTADTSSDLFTKAQLDLAGEPWTNIVDQGPVLPFYHLAIQTTVLNTGCGGLPITPSCFDTLQLILSNDPIGLVVQGGGFLIGFAVLEDAGFSINGGGTLTPVPVPGALALLASGLAGLGWLSRRRRKQFPA